MTKDKLRGLFIGVAIGDALGMPFESKSYNEIQKMHEITDYVVAKNRPRGSWTDDTQLTLAVANAFIEANGFNVDIIAQHHVKAYKCCTAGWKSTTKEAIAKIAEGTPITKSGDFSNFENVPMKAAPIAAYLSLLKSFRKQQIMDQIAAFVAMTHRTNIAVSSTLAHVFGLLWCLRWNIHEFHIEDFLDVIIEYAGKGKEYFPETAKDDLACKLINLKNSFAAGMLENDSNSLLFSYALFVRSPFNIGAIYDAVRLGANASLVGGLIGALNGTTIFPKHLIDGLRQKDKIVKIADKFYETFVVKII